MPAVGDGVSQLAAVQLHISISTMHSRRCSPHRIVVKWQTSQPLAQGRSPWIGTSVLGFCAAVYLALCQLHAHIASLCCHSIAKLALLPKKTANCLFTMHIPSRSLQPHMSYPSCIALVYPFCFLYYCCISSCISLCVFNYAYGRVHLLPCHCSFMLQSSLYFARVLACCIFVYLPISSHAGHAATSPL